ncbi:hypothetical protein TNCV_4475531 [Trichonephila clavipes]|nr:hypothetical protein TNCV_4475531 [Trichonephila clavipes]
MRSSAEGTSVLKAKLFLRPELDSRHLLFTYVMWNMSFRAMFLVQSLRGVPVTIRSSIHYQPVNQFFVYVRVHPTNSGNESRTMISRRMCFHETFHLAPSAARLHGVIFQNIRNSIKLRCQAGQTTSGRDFEQLL